MLIERRDRIRFIEQTVENATLPDGPVVGSDMLFESKRRQAALIRRLFKDLGIEGVVVTCPDNRDYILIRLPTLRWNPKFRHHTMHMWANRQRLYEKLDKIIRRAYPYLTVPLRFGTADEDAERERWLSQPGAKRFIAA